MAIPGLRTFMTVFLTATLVYGCSPVEMAVGAGAATGVAA
jgi:hypothetical protein